MILKLLAAFVPFEPNEFENLSSDARSWWAKIVYPGAEFGTPNTWSKEVLKKHMEAEEKKGNPQKESLMRLKWFCDQWVARACFAIGYIIGHREIIKYMNPKQDERDSDSSVH